MTGRLGGQGQKQRVGWGDVCCHISWLDSWNSPRYERGSDRRELLAAVGNPYTNCQQWDTQEAARTPGECCCFVPGASCVSSQSSKEPME